MTHRRRKPLTQAVIRREVGTHTGGGEGSHGYVWPPGHPARSNGAPHEPRPPAPTSEGPAVGDTRQRRRARARDEQMVRVDGNDRAPLIRRSTRRYVAAVFGARSARSGSHS